MTASFISWFFTIVSTLCSYYNRFNLL